MSQGDNSVRLNNAPKPLKFKEYCLNINPLQTTVNTSEYFQNNLFLKCTW